MEGSFCFGLVLFGCGFFNLKSNFTEWIIALVHGGLSLKCVWFSVTGFFPSVFPQNMNVFLSFLCPVTNEKYFYAFIFCGNAYLILSYYLFSNDSNPDAFPCSGFRSLNLQ